MVIRLTHCIAVLFLTFLNVHIYGQVPSPESFLGYELGSRYTRLPQVESYFKSIANQQSNILFNYYGHTWEHRPLFYVVISSNENIEHIDEIRTNNLKRAGLIEGQPFQNNISILWLSYNVHGNEASGTEAAIKTFYHLANEQSEEVQSWLKNTVVILDPCINPDGRERYVNWIYQFANQNPNPNPDAAEHHEPFLSGRYNHYMFDLNRDWAWQTQIESQQRLEAYHQWMPHVHIDYHEQSYDNNYYFAPAAEPIHQEISKWSKELQGIIGASNKKYFDERKWLYFTKENYDLLYPSYGDSYPSLNGAAGITYEMPGNTRAGLAVVTEKGDTLNLKERIEKHFITGISTIDACSRNASRITTEFENYFKESRQKKGCYIIQDRNEQKIHQVEELLQKNKIKYGKARLTGVINATNIISGDVKKVNYQKGAIIIPLGQSKYHFIKALIETNTQVSDSMTYDITSWSLPLNYHVETYYSDNIPGFESIDRKIEVGAAYNMQAYAYVADWNHLNDARFLSELTKNGIKTTYSTQSFRIKGKTFGPGSILISAEDNKRLHDFDAKVLAAAKKTKQELAALRSGQDISTFDAGSNRLKTFDPKQVGILMGSDISSTNTGEVWYFFEQELGYPASLLNVAYLNRYNLKDYDVIILPEGDYNDKIKEALTKWINLGGHLILIKESIDSFSETDELKLAKTEMEVEDRHERYGERSRKDISKQSVGSIGNIWLDSTHPIGYGYDDSFYLLMNFNHLYYIPEQGYVVAKSDENSKIINGFAGYLYKQNFRDKAFVITKKIGDGQVTSFVENPVFRAFWQDTKLLLANSIFFMN